ncbi:MAG: hypothetical protein VX780_01445 [Pseudomonadota bacterium]|nr:hypothetical protein [Pseudomonadota bacterium]
MFLESDKDKPLNLNPLTVLPNPAITQLTSQTGLYHISTNLEIQRVAKKLYQANCKTESKAIRNWQSIIAVSSEGASLKPYFSDGYVAVKAGVAIHVLKCEAIQATVDFEREGCFAELPIKIKNGNGTFKNESFWAHPVTKVLLPKSTPMPCHPKLPMVYKLDGLSHHFCSYGHGLTSCPNPDIITPTSANLHNQLKADISAPMGAGVMSDTRAKQLQFRVFHHQYALNLEAENLIKNKRKGNIDSGGPLELYPSDGLIDKWEWDVATSIAPFYSLFGNFYVYVIGLIMLCTVIGATCGFGARLYMELTINGITFRLFFAIFQGLYHIFTVPLEFIKSGYQGTVHYSTQGVDRATEPLRLQVQQLQNQLNRIHLGQPYRDEPEIDLRSEENPYNPPRHFPRGGQNSTVPPLWDMKHQTPNILTPLSQPIEPVEGTTFNKLFNRKKYLQYRDQQKAFDAAARALQSQYRAQKPQVDIADTHQPTAPPPPPTRSSTTEPYKPVSKAVRQEQYKIDHEPHTFYLDEAAQQMQTTARYSNDYSATAGAAAAALNSVQDEDEGEESHSLIDNNIMDQSVPSTYTTMTKKKHVIINEMLNQAKGNP